MNENSFISQRTHTRVKFSPLTVSCHMVCITEMSPCAQSIDTLGESAEYEPDRSLTPTVILPEVRVTDPDDIFHHGNANEFLTTDSDKMIWLVDGEPISDVWSVGTDYSIDVSESDMRGALTVKKNFPANSNIVLTFKGQFLDWRTGIVYNVESDEISLTCTDKGTDVIACSVDKPLITYDPVYDNLLLWEHKKALGLPVRGTRGDAIDGKSYEQEVNVLLTKGLKELDYDTLVETTDGFLFRKTAHGQLIANPALAQLTALRGKSVVWNQLVNGLNQSGFNPISYSDGVFTINFAQTSSEMWRDYLIGTMNITREHKYILYVKYISGTLTGNIKISDGSNTYILLNADRDSIKLVTAHTSQTSPGFGLLLGADSSATAYKCKICIFDLTLMFGAGNEPSTVEEFEALFPNEYYPYNTGSLLNFNAESLKTVGFNQWDEQWELGNYNAAGEPVMITTQIRSLATAPIQVLPSTEYCFTSLGAGYVSAIIWYDSNDNFISRYNPSTYNVVVSSPSNAKYLRFQCQVVYGNIYNNDICINISDPSKNGTYEPYWESNLPLNINTQTGKLNGTGDSVVVFPDGMAGINGLQDTIIGNSATKKFTQIGSLNTLDIALNYEGYEEEEGEGDIRYSFNVRLPKKGKNFTLNALFSSVYEVSNNIDYTSSNNFCIKEDSNGGYIEIMDDNFAEDARFGDEEQWGALIAAIKASLAGKSVMYELEEYERYTVDDMIDMSEIKGKLDGQGESVVIFPYGIKTLGTIADQIEETEATKKIMTVDLGSLDIVFGEDYKVGDEDEEDEKFRYYFEVRLNKLPAQNKFSQGRCEKYTGVESLEYYNTNTFTINWYTGYVMILDSRFADDVRMSDEEYYDEVLAELKSYLSGVLFDYELKTYEEYVLDDNIGLNMKVDYLGTEEVIYPDDTAPSSTLGEMDIQYKVITDGLTMRVVKLGTSSALEPNSESSPELIEALYPTLKFDMRMIDSAEYEVQFVKEGNIVARASIGLNRGTTMPFSGQTMFSADIVSGQQTYKNTALLQLRDRIIEYPELYYLLHWFTQTQYKDGSIWKYKDAMPWQYGKHVSVNVKDIGMGTTKNDSWFDVWFECDAHEASTLLTDENDDVLTDENGDFIID